MSQQSIFITDGGGSGVNMTVGNDGYTAVHQADSPWVTSVSGTVDVSGSSVTVSGTVAATQSGTWTVQQGTPPWSMVGTYGPNVAAGTDALKGLVGRYNSSLPTLSDGYVSYLAVDSNGRLITTASVSFTYVADPNTALPTQTAWMGASDGTNLQGLLVESASAKNLRTSLYYGANEMIIGTDGYTAVHQADSPWVVSGTVAVSSVSGTVAVTQSTSPWVVSGTVTADAGTGTFNVAGTVAATQSGTWTVQQGTPPWTVTGTYASNVAAGTDAVKSLVGQYNSSLPTISDGYLTYLQTDSNGRLLTTATLSPSFVAADNTALPADAAWMGASDGTNLQGLEVESATYANLKVGLFSGATQASITASNTAVGNGLQVLGAEYLATGAATGLTGPVDGYRFAGTALTSGNATFAQTDGYGRLEMTGARAVAYAFENRASQTITLKSGSGVLRKVIVGNAGKTGATLTFYDNTAASGTIIAVINTSSILGQLVFDIPFAVGLTYTTSSQTPAASFTVTFE